MTAVDVVIRAAGPADAPAVTAMLAAAFATGPLAEWVVPDPATRALLYAAHGAEVCADALERGWIHTTADHRAAAVWYPGPGPDYSAPERPDLERPAARRPAGERSTPARLAHLEEVLAALVPPHPHHQLAYLGVHPEYQRRGLGTALLAHHHAYLDATGMAAFLVATSEGSRDLYLRHGYTVVTVATLSEGPPLWAMWRDPVA